MFIFSQKTLDKHLFPFLFPDAKTSPSSNCLTSIGFVQFLEKTYVYPPFSFSSTLEQMFVIMKIRTKGWPPHTHNRVFIIVLSTPFTISVPVGICYFLFYLFTIDILSSSNHFCNSLITVLPVMKKVIFSTLCFKKTLK